MISQPLFLPFEILFVHLHHRTRQQWFGETYIEKTKPLTIAPRQMPTLQVSFSPDGQPVVLNSNIDIMLGTPEIVLIVLVVLLLFGGKKIPELMKGLGKGVKSFKDGVNGIEKDLDPDQQTNDTETKK